MFCLYPQFKMIYKLEARLLISPQRLQLRGSSAPFGSCKSFASFGSREPAFVPFNLYGSILYAGAIPNFTVL